MRFLIAITAAVFVFVLQSTAYAGCGGKLGTHRTISLDPKKHSAFTGRERALGLRNKEVILTFDDGPIAGKTSKILATLKRECVKATFFAVGKMARAYPSLTKRIVREGHTLAHHTSAHQRLPKYSIKNASRHINQGVRQVQKAAYNKTFNSPRVPFFRFPYLATSKGTRRLVRNKNMIAFGTNIDSLDWKRNSPDTIVNRVMSKLRKQKKGIILMHDIHNRTALALPKLLRRLKREGYKVVHMVPKRGKGRVARIDLETNTGSIKPTSSQNSTEWTIRKTRAIASSFIIAFDDAEMNLPIYGGNETASQSTKSTKASANRDLFKEWALRAAFSTE